MGVIEGDMPQLAVLGTANSGTSREISDLDTVLAPATAVGGLTEDEAGTPRHGSYFQPIAA